MIATAKRPLLVADLFCGAGGFDAGLKLALAKRELGVTPQLLAVNHWQTAIDTHERNHPEARRVCVDAYDLDPLKAIPGGELDLLMASPTCTFFSRARGGRPVSWDQRKGRMTPSQVYRWCRDLKVKRLLVENVPEFMDWGPVCKRTTSCKEHGWSGPKVEGDICGKPRRNKRGVYFRRWVARLRKLGFRVEWRIINAADHGDATTRSRFYLIGRSDGGEIRWPEPSHSKDGTPDLFGGGVRRWRAAREIIKWKRRGKSIFSRKKPLAAKTLLRIHAGLIKFGWPVRFVLKLRLYMLSLGVELPELVSTGRDAQPFVFQLNQARDRARGLRSVDDPLDTVVTRDFKGLVEPLVMLSNQQGGNGLNVRRSTEPLYTISTDGGVAVVEPFVLNRHGENGSSRAHSVEAPLPTADCRGAGYVVEPFLLPQHFGRPTPPPVAVDRTGLVEGFTFANRSGNAPRGAGEPIAPVVTSGGIGVVEPFLLSQGAGGAPRSVDAPVPTIPTEGAHAFVSPYYGMSTPTSVEQPLRAVTTKDRFGLVVGELAFVTGAFGEREGQAARVRSVEEPVPTLCAQGRIPLVHGVTSEDLDQIDILFRMLEPDELAAAMGFPKAYRFTGNKTERTRQIGNAVAVNTAAALVGALLEAS